MLSMPGNLYITSWDIKVNDVELTVKVVYYPSEQKISTIGNGTVVTDELIEPIPEKIIIQSVSARGSDVDIRAIMPYFLEERIKDQILLMVHKNNLLMQ